MILTKIFSLSKLENNIQMMAVLAFFSLLGLLFMAIETKHSGVAGITDVSLILILAGMIFSIFPKTKKIALYSFALILPLFLLAHFIYF